MSGQNMIPSLSSGRISSATSEAATAYGGWACTIALYALFLYTAKWTRYSLEASFGTSPLKGTNTGSPGSSR